MFGSILILAVTLTHLYVFWRVATVPLLERHVPRIVLVGAGLVLWSAFFFGRILSHGGTGAMAGFVEMFGMTWMGVLFLIAVSLLAVELVTGFGFFLPRTAPTLRSLALLIGGVLSVIALVQGLRPPVVQNYEVSLSGLPREMDGTVIIAVSDLHLGSQLGKQWLEERLAQIREQRPDLVVLLGDLFKGHGMPMGELLPVLRRFSAPLGVWAVPGNHEFHGGNDTSLSLIKEDGIQVLLNRWVEVRPGLVLAGIEDLTADRRAGRSGDPLSKALADRPPGATVLLSHTPWQAERAANAGVGLMLSGHTHGGQIWPFGYLIRLSYPLLEGRYEIAGMTAIVCRGTGTWGPRMRLWHPGEMLRVTLHVAHSHAPAGATTHPFMTFIPQ
jgi:predicted MPP superfamily phosphohydrolase